MRIVWLFHLAHNNYCVRIILSLPVRKIKLLLAIAKITCCSGNRRSVREVELKVWWKKSANTQTQFATLFVIRLSITRIRLVYKEKERHSGKNLFLIYVYFYDEKMSRKSYQSSSKKEKNTTQIEKLFDSNSKLCKKVCSKLWNNFKRLNSL